MQPATHHRPLDPVRLRSLRAHPSRGRAASLGALGEELAVRHLVDDDGLVVLARNWRISRDELRGELDVVALDEAASALVICEVKTRRDAQRFGGARAALGIRQQRRLRALTAAFLRDAPVRVRGVRLDLVAVDVGDRPSLTHLENAL